MYAKIQITGVLEVKTGMHIGGSSAFAAIGAVDAPIIKDVRSNLPMIPGSSLKGKMRTLLAKEYNETLTNKPDDDAECLIRLFGSSKKGNVKTSRILISDMIMSNKDELRANGLQSMTEIKFENTINRATGVANPRQIERAVRGSRFDLDIIYGVDKADEILEDITILAEGVKLLQYDYLGGSGSRGYGKVRFEDIAAEVVIGEVDDAIMEQCNAILKQKTE
jgi:CRISPR-associated protein Csm3